MSIYLIYLFLLRALHTFAGIFWVGGAIMHLAFIEPTVKATAPEGHKFMQHLVGRGRFILFMNTVSLLTVLSGALLYWHTSFGLQTGWITSGPGLGFTIGSVVGIAVYIFGMTMIGPRVKQLGGLGHQIAMAGGVPTPPQAAQLEKLDQELTLAGRVDFALLAISTLAMATARYWVL